MLTVISDILPSLNVIALQYEPPNICALSNVTSYSTASSVSFEKLKGVSHSTEPVIMYLPVNAISSPPF